MSRQAQMPADSQSSSSSMMSRVSTPSARAIPLNVPSFGSLSPSRIEYIAAGVMPAVRANFAQYVDTLSNADVGFNNPIAVSSVQYPWIDANANLLVETSELDTTTILGCSTWGRA